jgi:3-dehydroquinate synthase
MTLTVTLPHQSYDITIERGLLGRAAEHINLNRRVLIVTDSGVPAGYAQTIAAQCQSPTVVTVEQGEASKSLSTFEMLCRTMLENGFTRRDCVVAVGGGVVGDLAGFAAASYMRGIDFYNMPTTLLSQVDSSIGGKVAVNFEGIKNILGAFYQPAAVLIDPDTLDTLDPRQVASGMAEAIKMALTFDTDFFAALEAGNVAIEEIIWHSLECKRKVVEQDEKEAGLRKVLNFGHTIGHAIESLGGRLHGECVAIAMLPMAAPELRARIAKVLEAYHLPTGWSGDPSDLFAAAAHDKKANAKGVSVVTLPAVGSFALEEWSVEKLQQVMKEYFA